MDEGSGKGRSGEGGWETKTCARVLSSFSLSRTFSVGGVDDKHKCPPLQLSAVRSIVYFILTACAQNKKVHQNSASDKHAWQSCGSHYLFVLGGIKPRSKCTELTPALTFNETVK